MKLRLYSFSRQIKNVLQLLSEVRYGNCSAQTNSSSQQHFADIAPSTVVEIEFDSRFGRLVFFDTLRKNVSYFKNIGSSS